MKIKNKTILHFDDLKSKIKKCLVVGGGFGFLGNNLVEALILNDCEVNILSHIPVEDIHPGPVEDIHPGVKFFLGDIRNLNSVLEACRGVDTVFHVASIILTSSLMRKSTKEWIYSVNVKGTENVIQACQECNVSRLIYTSTNNVVFDHEIKNGDETLPYATHIDDLYTETKLCAEKKIIAANSQSLSTCALRPGGIYGPRDKLILRRFVKALKSGCLLFKLGDNRALGDSVYIDNLVYAHLLAARRLEKNSVVAGQVYFISDGEPSNYFEFLKPLILGLGYRYPKLSIPYSLAYFFAFISEVDFIINN